MLKTNNKQVKQYFNNYLNDIIIDHFEGDIQNLVNQFYESARDSRGRLYQNYKTYQEAFETISFNYGECYTSDIKNTLKEALQETDEEVNKYDDEKVQNLYNTLLYRAYLERCKAENLNPLLFKMY